MEGGGSNQTSKTALRRGMDEFLRPLKQAARRRALKWKLVLCGSRSETSRRFRDACKNAGPAEEQILLVDSEAPVSVRPRAHLREQSGDRWDLTFARRDTVHLMVQVMETWIVADPDAMAGYYGRRFDLSRLPKRTDLEGEPKANIQRAIREATKSTRKGAYQKIRDASRLLMRIDRERVMSRCQHCKRLFEELGRIIEAS